MKSEYAGKHFHLWSRAGFSLQHWPNDKVEFKTSQHKLNIVVDIGKNIHSNGTGQVQCNGQIIEPKMINCDNFRFLYSPLQDYLEGVAGCKKFQKSEVKNTF